MLKHARTGPGRELLRFQPAAASSYMVGKPCRLAARAGTATLRRMVSTCELLEPDDRDDQSLRSPAERAAESDTATRPSRDDAETLGEEGSLWPPEAQSSH